MSPCNLWFTAGTSCEDCATRSDDGSAPGQSARKRLRIPRGSPRNVRPPASCSCRSSLPRPLSWRWDKTLRILLPVAGETEPAGVES
ncbi:mCG147282 [Mus musculus]|nr:mCG147282 [Mus musculus]